MSRAPLRGNHCEGPACGEQRDGSDQTDWMAPEAAHICRLLTERSANIDHLVDPQAGTWLIFWPRPGG